MDASSGVASFTWKLIGRAHVKRILWIFSFVYANVLRCEQAERMEGSAPEGSEVIHEKVEVAKAVSEQVIKSGGKNNTLSFSGENDTLCVTRRSRQQTTLRKGKTDI